MGGSLPRVNRFAAHDLETDWIAPFDPPPALRARFEAGVSELVSDEQRRRNAPLCCGRFASSRCDLIGWLWRRCLATGERDQREREPSASGERNSLAAPVHERWVF
jgi:hypothetical protein